MLKECGKEKAKGVLHPKEECFIPNAEVKEER
jgi:hypothetical protein